MEEEQIKTMVNDVLKLKPTLVVTEKGCSELASYLLAKEGVSVIRRVKKTDNNRIAKACGATIVHRPEELKEEDVGTSCGLFEIKKIGDEYFTFLTECENPKACTVVLRGKEVRGSFLCSNVKNRPYFALLLCLNTWS